MFNKFAYALALERELLSGRGNELVLPAPNYTVCNSFGTKERTSKICVALKVSKSTIESRMASKSTNQLTYSK